MVTTGANPGNILLEIQMNKAFKGGVKGAVGAGINHVKHAESSKHLKRKANETYNQVMSDMVTGFYKDRQ